MSKYLPLNHYYPCVSFSILATTQPNMYIHTDREGVREREKSHIESSFSVRSVWVWSFVSDWFAVLKFDIHRIFWGCKVIWVAAWYTGIKVLGFGILVFPLSVLFSCLRFCVSLCFQHEKSVVVCLLRCVQNANWDIHSDVIECENAVQ